MKLRDIVRLVTSANVLLVLVFLVDCEEQETLPTVSMDTFWEVATPSSQQMDEAAIEEVRSMVSKLDGVYSFLIVRNGKIVHEQYHNGAKQNTLLHTRSVTKRITSTLIGIAIDQGYIDSARIRISNFFPEIASPGAAQRWDQITVHHLLNMVSGMDWVEEEDLNEYERNLKDPLKYIFAREIRYQPETYYSYNSPGTHLLSHIIERASGDRVADFAEANLFASLGILGYEWQQDGAGVKRGEAGLELTARDLAKIGLLYLQDGKWQGQQIISEQWIDQCFNQVIPLDNIEGNHLPGIAIGQTWWARNFAGERIHYGDGYGGQILLVIPKYEIVLVMNRAYKVEGGKNYAAFESFFNDILPGVLDSILK